MNQITKNTTCIKVITKKLHGVNMNKKIVLILILLIYLTIFSTANVYATDNDGDGEHIPYDCDDTNYYRYTGAINIPFDNKENDCEVNEGDSTLNDINDIIAPSNNATYYFGETVTIIGNNFKPNFDVRILILDAENRTFVGPDPTKIDDYHTDDDIWQGFITTNSTGSINKTITLIDAPEHGLGIYTIYIWFTAYPYLTAAPGKNEFIPVDTFTVVENHAPNATIQNITGYENKNITFTLPATDSDGDPLTYSSDNPNITWNGTHLYYEADYDTVIHPNLTKTITVNITADDTRLTYTQEVNITIIDVNRLPVLTLIGSKFINENELLSFNLSATDVDSDPLTFDAQPSPIGATLTGNIFSWTPDPAQAGIYNINFSVTDGIDSVNETVQITVADLAGDYSGDSATDAWDITYLARSIAGISGYETLFSGDVSGDSNVDAWDITYLARAIAGIIGYELSPALPSMELCASCHVTTAQILSNSNTKHSNLACAYCHPTHGQIPTCVSCHATPHGPAFTDCGISCHLSAHDVWKVQG